ncbi:extracellular catalytic domain type 1 short-chain-length polyhydroxyalkanoate depolymerase [Gemmatimonas phototrophica]|uniref:extracellular catalytic domain type 1 short-chain-length polyhydroxyalkanoate depolymerase n=1 Tax=Gemmatimonas phototrophica TaxID=1379270 RepID=UPI001314BD54|nr:PHB depolymerase family esterase [Gemmatimonas phototrophica]
MAAVAPTPEAPAQVITGRHTGPHGSRAWRLVLPTAPASTPRPLVVMLHGCLQDAADIARGSGFDAVAEQGGALVLYPEQPESANPRKCWNWFDAAHQQRGRGEPALLSALIEEVRRSYGGQSGQVHLVGISAGGAMANLLFGAYPEQFASVMTVAGVAWQAAPNVGRALAVMQQGAGDALPGGAAWLTAMGSHAQAVPVVVVHGVADPVVSVRNADETARQYVQLHDALAARQGAPALVVTELPAVTMNGVEVRETQWRNASGQTMVALLRVEGLAHAFPRGDASGSFTDPRGPDLVARLRAFLTASRR